MSYAWGASLARKPLANEVYLALRVAGLRVWMDDLEMGHDLAASMSEGIAKSDVVVMLVSPDYAASKPCMFEARAAVAAGKPLVTCCVEPGFWRSWIAADGSGARAVPDDHELVALARLTTHLFVDLGTAAAVSWTDESLAPAERKTLTLREAMPRLLTLVEAERSELAGAAGAAQPYTAASPRAKIVTATAVGPPTASGGAMSYIAALAASAKAKASAAAFAPKAKRASVSVLLAAKKSAR